MPYKQIRETIKQYTESVDTRIQILQGIGIDITRDGFFRVRPDDKTPSCKINKDGSFHDFGSGEHYTDIVTLLFDGYHAFNSLPETMEWLCLELGIEREVNHE